MKDCTATARYGITRKRRKKGEKHKGQLSRDNLQIEVVY